MTMKKETTKAGPGRPKKTKSFKYKVVQIPGNLPLQELQEALNKIGADGWQFKTIRSKILWVFMKEV